MLDFLTKYFAVLSAALLGLSSSVVIVFVFGYLYIFDWNLIWIVEYLDMTKFMLLTIAIAISLYISVQSYGNLASNVAHADFPFNWKQYIVMSLWSIIILSAIWSGYFFRGRLFIEFYLYLQLSVMLIIGFAIWAFRFGSAFTTKPRLSQFQTISLFMLSVWICGNTCGLYVKDISTSEHDIYTSSEILKGQKIIMLLSHHSIFYSNGDITLVQSSDVKKIVSLSPKTPVPHGL